MPIKQQADAKGWKLYILECNNGAYYTGITNNLEQRLSQHEAGKGAKYMRGKAPFKLLYTEEFKSRGEASSREAEIKLLNREAKIKLVAEQQAKTPTGKRRLLCK